MLTFFFLNATPTTKIYPLSLPDALPICRRARGPPRRSCRPCRGRCGTPPPIRARCRRPRRWPARSRRSEEHTSELQSRQYLVCRLLLEKKKILTLELITP